MNKLKETSKQRIERIQLNGTTITKIIPDKTKYNRKGKKHELKLDNNNEWKYISILPGCTE